MRWRERGRSGVQALREARHMKISRPDGETIFHYLPVRPPDVFTDDANSSDFLTVWTRFRDLFCANKVRMRLLLYVPLKCHFTRCVLSQIDATASWKLRCEDLQRKLQFINRPLVYKANDITLLYQTNVVWEESPTCLPSLCPRLWFRCPCDHPVARSMVPQPQPWTLPFTLQHLKFFIIPAIWLWSRQLHSTTYGEEGSEYKSHQAGRAALPHTNLHSVLLKEKPRAYAWSGVRRRKS